MLRFDEPCALEDLLSPQQLRRLEQGLSVVAGTAIALSGDGEVPVELNLDRIGGVSGDAPADRLVAAADIVALVAYMAARYRIAANMHVDGMQEGYEELQRQHEALRKSEERYRQLANELQERVDAQVAVIASNQRELYESARLRGIGQLAAGVAHEINTPAGFITSNLGSAAHYLDELQAALPAGALPELMSDFRDLIAECRAGADRIAGIVRCLRVFSNIDGTDFVPCDVPLLVNTACRLLQAEFPEHRAIDVRCEPVPAIAGHPARISQAIYNVVRNAMQATATGGGVFVCVASSGGIVEVRVEDEGHGVEAGKLPHVFDPFFTTRDVGDGAGLGLSVARDIMTAHGGHIHLAPRIGGGCVATLRFGAGG